MKRLLIVTILLCGTLALAQERAAEPAKGETAHHEAVDNAPHPVISHDSSWAGEMVIIVLGMFLLAAAVGVAVRANMPEEPAAAAHHDDHGHDDHGHADHGHGH